jgi:uncharacterized protein (DUF169 family)
MATVEYLKNYAAEIERRVLLRTHPIAIKMLKDTEEIPSGAIRPIKDLGTHISLCQGFAMSRRENKTVAMFNEDNWCYAPLVGFGFVEPTEKYFDGTMSYPERIASLEAAKRLAKESPRIKPGKYTGIVSAPLKTISFMPDVVIIYCNMVQLRGMLLAMKYKDGYQVTTTLDPGGACIQSTVPVLLSGDCQVTVPCGGDYKYALAQDDEIIFSIPTSRMDDFMLGLRNAANSNYVDFYQNMRYEYPLSESYIKMGKSLDMDIH